MMARFPQIADPRINNLALACFVSSKTARHSYVMVFIIISRQTRPIKMA